MIILIIKHLSLKSLIGLRRAFQVNKMNPELKKRWVDALRSGEYQQGTSVLRDKNDRRCCLGVLCEFVPVEVTQSNSAFYEYTFEVPEDYILNDYKDRSGGVPSFLVHSDDAAILVRMNDDQGKSFSEIADYIEANL